MNVDLADRIRAQVRDATPQQLQAAVRAVLDQHRPMPVPGDAERGPYLICAACCTVDDVQGITCRRRHEHYEVGATCVPCSTVFALAGAVGVVIRELGLRG